MYDNIRDPLCIRDHTAMFPYPFVMPQAPETLSQAINPWSWMFHTNASDNQNGLINITTYKSTDPQLEQRITHQAAGYGMQLNVIEHALSAVIDILPKDSITPKQQQAFDALADMMSNIQAEKDRATQERFSAGGISRFIHELQALKEKQPEHYTQIAKQLKNVLNTA